MNKNLRDPSFWAFSAYVAIAVVPIVFGLLYAAGYSVGLTGLMSEGLTLAYWRQTLARGEIWYSFATSAYVATATMLLTWLTALPTSLGLRGSLTSGPLATAIYLPLALPMTVAAFVVFQLFTGSGLLARLAAAMGFMNSPQDFGPLVHDPASIGVIAAFLLITLPYFVLLLRQFYREEAVADLCHLTQTLGGTHRDCLRHVAIPVLWRRARIHSLLWWISVFGAYEVPLLLGIQSPQMISVLTMRKFQMFDLHQKPTAYIAALLYSALVVLVLWFVFKRTRRGATGV